MRILFGVLLLALLAAAAPEGGELKEKIQAMLDEAALLEQAGRGDEAARVRAEAEELKRKAEAPREKDDPRMQALASMEKAIGALEKAGYEGMAKELRGMAERLRSEVKGARGQEGDFWRRNLDTLRSAVKALAETGRHDAADVLERAIRGRELLLEGKPDMAERAMREGPDDAQLSELLLKAAGCWREFKQPEKALQCEELGRYLQHSIEKRRAEKTMEFARGGREGPGPDDRLARLEERLDRMERMLHATLERLERQERERGAEGERGRERGRAPEREDAGK